MAAAALVGLGIYFYCLRFANLEWKLFLIYCAAPVRRFACQSAGRRIQASWDLLVVDFSARYWFFPMLAFVWSAVWCALTDEIVFSKSPGSASFSA